MTGIFGNNFGNNYSISFVVVPVVVIGPEVIILNSTDSKQQLSSTDTKYEVG